MAIIILWRTGVLDPAAEDVVARVAAEKGSKGVHPLPWARQGRNPQLPLPGLMLLLF